MWSLNDEKDVEDDADGIDANEAEAAAAEPKKNRLHIVLVVFATPYPSKAQASVSSSLRTV